MGDQSSKGSAAGSTAPYAGDIDSEKAWALLADDRDAVLVDVRTRAEWEWVGVPDLAALGKQVVFVSWQSYPPLAINPEFTRQVAAAGIKPDAPVIFICRSGGRSRSAAIVMTAAGFKQCYNLAGGFEGPLDPEHHRGAVDGWKARGFPWIQG